MSCGPPGCSNPRRRNPMKTFVRFSRLLPVLLSLTVCVLPVTGGADRPWLGTVSGDESGAPLIGHASHLGDCLLDGYGVVFVEPGLFAGPGTLTAANGDEVHLSWIAFYFPVTGPETDIPFTGAIIVDGGTGRFQGATGSASFTGFQDYAGGPFSFTWLGTISY